MNEQKTVTCVGLNGHKTDVPVDHLTFRPSVFGVIVRDGKVLLSSQWDGWDFPGGGMHIDESIDDAFKREVGEESGLTVERGELLHVSDHFFTHPETQKHYHTILMYFTVSRFEGDIPAKDASAPVKIDMREVQWVPLESVSSLKFYNQVDSPLIIRLAADGKRI
jgi:ADP-ribose pyrophosphatase YjhB (NUDIX family)